MPSKAVHDAVIAKLDTWSSLANCPLSPPNDLGDSPAQNFLELEYPVANENQLELGQVGARTFRETGAIRFTVNTRAFSGITQALTWVGELRALFGADDFAGVHVITASPPPIIRDRDQAGAFYAMPFIVTYHYDYTR